MFNERPVLKNELTKSQVRIELVLIFIFKMSDKVVANRPQGQIK